MPTSEHQSVRAGSYLVTPDLLVQEEQLIHYQAKRRVVVEGVKSSPPADHALQVLCGARPNPFP